MRRGRGHIQWIVVPVSLLIVLACVLPGACTFSQGPGQSEPERRRVFPWMGKRARKSATKRAVS